jgi:hypothetical protein
VATTEAVILRAGTNQTTRKTLPFVATAPSNQAEALRRFSLL